eukprot:1158513-Pelagomonas_calceolata.AAC.2
MGKKGMHSPNSGHFISLRTRHAVRQAPPDKPTCKRSSRLNTRPRRCGRRSTGNGLQGRGASPAFKSSEPSHK